MWSRKIGRSRAAKRLMDLTGASIGLILLLPLMLLIALVISLTMGFPVLFRQVRPGLHGKPFVLYKFRTMREFYDAEGKPLPDELRVTALGRLLRRTRLDEIPELVNVLRGDMSPVGPRPLLMQHVHLLDDFQKRRFLVRPGITGWAQVHGNTRLDLDTKCPLDVWYVNNSSLWLDVVILLKTLLVIVMGERIDNGKVKLAEEHARCLGWGR